MKKRILRLVVTISMIISISSTFNLTVSAETKYTEGYYTYTVANREATITKCDTSASGAIEIPSMLGGYQVKRIGNESFRDCTKLISITIPDSVTSIGISAFSICESLTRVVIPNSVTSIGDYAFYGCSSLTSITIPDSVTSIGDCAFFGHGSLTSITIPDSVTSIGDYAFSGCRSLRKITIGNGVTNIGSGAFSECSNLTSITIPDSVTSIGDYVFDGCSSLTSINVSKENLHYLSDEYGVLFDKDKTELICYPMGSSLRTYEIPDSVTSIRRSAFSKCSNLTSITIPDSVTSIGISAFSICESLTSVVIPNSVTSIGDYAFSYCRRLSEITIGNGVTSIGNHAFSECSNLTSIIIPDSVTSIESGAFSDCESLTSVVIPNSVTSIGDYAFYGCSSLTSITIPDSVTIIYYLAFYNCTSLTDVYYSGTKEDWERIVIGGSNESLTNATIHYNYSLFNLLFDTNSYQYNHNLARESFEFAEAGFSAVKEYSANGNDNSDIAKKRYANIKKKYDEYGFTENQKFYNYGIELKNTTDKAAYSIATKDIVVDGETKKLVVLVVRGGNYGGEWVSNFNVGNNSMYSQGFKKPADEITNKLKSYISAYKTDGVVLWMTSYSRGAAITNLVAANMVDYADSCSYLDADKIFAYTFATPRPVHVRNANAGNEKYNNIFNIVNPVDAVPSVLLSDWGYGRYGVTKTILTTVPKQVKEYYKEYTGDEYSVSSQQRSSVSNIIALLSNLADTKLDFHNEYQTIIQDIISWLMVHTKVYKDDSLIDYAITKYDSKDVVRCYQYASADVDAYKKILIKAGVKESYITLLKQVGTIFELQGKSIDKFIDDVLGSNSIEALKSILKIISAVSDLDGNFGGLGIAHEPDTYRAWLFGMDDPNKIFTTSKTASETFVENSNKYKKQLIQCPVDVEVTDAEGNVVVSVVNHEILIDELPVVVIDDKIKIFYYDNFEDYNLKITAYEDGEVNYYVSEYASGTDETKRVCYNNISVSANDTLTGLMNDEIDTDVKNYNLTLSETSIDNTEILTEADLENLSVEVTVEGSGSAADIFGVSTGDYVTLNAEPFEGAKFVGWYNGETCVSEEMQYSFVIDKNHQMCAKFTVSPAEISDITIPEITDDIISNSVTISANEDIIGDLVFTAYSGDTVASTYIRDVSMSNGEVQSFDSEFEEDSNINMITACLYDTNEAAMTAELTVAVVRELLVGENDNYKYIIYPDTTIEITKIKTEISEMFEIPETIDGYMVCAIGENLFANNSDIVEITLPKTVSLIKTGAFWNCENLEWINFRGSREEWNCINGLNDAAIPEEVSIAPNYADTLIGMGETDIILKDDIPIVKANLDYVKQTGIAYLGVYGKSGNLIMLSSDPVAKSDTNVNFSMYNYKYKEGDYAKVFVWDSNINPLSQLRRTELSVLAEIE